MYFYLLMNKDFYYLLLLYLKNKRKAEILKMI